MAYIKQDNNYDVTLCISPQVTHVGIMLTVDLNGSDRPGYVPNRQVNTTNLSQTINKSITDNTTYHFQR